VTQNQDDSPRLLGIGTTKNGPFSVDANLIATGRTCVLGSSGSGKSYTVGVLCEELCRNGIPFAIIDNEGEHTGLKEKYEAIWVGEEEGCDLSWDAIDLQDLAKQAPDVAPLILDVSDLNDPREKVSSFVKALYDTLTERRTPYLLVVEEADKFVPQYGERIPIIPEIARRGRKRGLGLMICSQRPSLVDKNVLSQCGNQLVGRLIIRNDLQSVAQFFPGKGLPKELTALRAGEFFAMGGFCALPVVVQIRKRTTKPGGGTPTLAKRVMRAYAGAARGTEEWSEGTASRTLVLQEHDRRLGLPPSIKPEDIPAVVKRQRSLGILGSKEAVTSVELEYRSLIQLAVRIRRGFLKKRFETVYFFLDGGTGKRVSLNRGLDVKPGFENLLGLTTLQVEVLKETRPDYDTSAFDVASRLGEAKSTVTKVLNTLNEKKLVRTIEVGKKRLYRRLVNLPGKPEEFVPRELDLLDPVKGRIIPAKMREQDVREAVKGLWDGADVFSFDTMLYPVFKVDLLLRRRHRQVLLDGRSGKELVI